MDDAINKKSNKRIISTIFLLVLMGAVIAGTFALWQTTRKQTDRNLVGSACLDITYSNETGDISLPSAWPMTDNEGKATTPYSFTITNNCDIAVNYLISLESIANPNDANASYINDNYIDVYLDDGILTNYGSLPTITSDTNTSYTIRNTRKITTEKLFAHESKTHNLRLWLDEDTPTTEMNKGFYSKIKIVGGQGIELDCYAVNSEGVLTKYNPDCGMSASIPAEVNGIPVTKIASDAFVSDYSWRYFTNEGITEDDIDFSIVLDGEKSIAYENQDYATLATITSDDVKFVIYDDDTRKAEEAITYLKQNPDQIVSGLYQLESISSLVVDDIAIYNLDNLPSRLSGYEHFYKIQKTNGQTTAVYVGYRASRDYIDSRFISDINYLDLTHATNLVEVEDRAFSGLYMHGLTLEFPPSLRKIGNSAFEGTACNILLNNGLLTIGDFAFYENYYMNSVDIPSSVTTIGEAGLSWNSNLTVTVHTQALYDTRSTWAPQATVIYDP